MNAPGDPRLAAALRDAVDGEVLFDAASRGRYSTDASIYQVEPIGVVVPRNEEAAIAALDVARDFGIPVLPRGGGTSQCGQTVGAALVIDASKHLNQVLDLDPVARTVTVQPGLVLDQLNARLKPQGLFYPVDVSTAAQATLGGMAGNNSCGARSLAYGNMVHNVLAIDAVLADGGQYRFGPVPGDLAQLGGPPAYRALVEKVRALWRREADEVEARFPKLQRRVGGYNLDTVAAAGHNMAHLLVGSEGTLAFTRRLTLKLSPLPRHKVLGVVHFPTFYQAMDTARHIVTLNPAAVELVDRTMLELSLDIPAFRDIVRRYVKGQPDAILLTEFAGDDLDRQVQGLKRLAEMMADLGLPGSVVEITDAAGQRDLWEVRKAGLNIMMSMKGDGKPVSFIEDCAVPLEHLAEYTDRLTRVFEKHGTRGTWYAHASVGCLHVRPVLNMKNEEGARKMRAIAEEAAAMVREYKGSYSGEHGDGLVRSEWIAPMFGERLTRAFEEVKDLFDPDGRMNPGKIVRPPRMDDRSLFRFKPGYRRVEPATVLDWSEWGGLAPAAEMCNNNGTCRKRDAAVMCPSYRATGDERHVTRGRANTLRLALSGQLGPDALTGDELADTLSLCVSCKGCRRECPTGVDMARMKIEVTAQRARVHGVSLRSRLVAELPRWIAGPLGGMTGLREMIPGARWLGEKVLGFSAKRRLPARAAEPFRDEEAADADADVILFADTFNRWQEPDNLRAAVKVLRAAGRRVAVASSPGGALCCGRTWLTAGLVEEAREVAGRTVAALAPHVARGAAIVGLEPSCLLGLRDEIPVFLKSAEARQVAEAALTFEEYLARESRAGTLQLPLKAGPAKALLHGHCHQKSFDLMGDVETCLKLIPGLSVETVPGSCCGMAGAFGYEAEHYGMSMRMAEATLLPAIRKADPGTVLVADGTSCRHQIKDGAEREAVHVARVLAGALE